MNESRYLQLFSDGSDALLRLIGLDQAYLATGFSWFTVETHIMHKGEAHAGDLVEVTSQVLAADEKRMHLFQTATRTDDGAVVATAEQMLLHVDTKAGRACLAGARDARAAAAHRGGPGWAAQTRRRRPARRRAEALMDFALTPEQEMVVATVRASSRTSSTR